MAGRSQISTHLCSRQGDLMKNHHEDDEGRAPAAQQILHPDRLFSPVPALPRPLLTNLWIFLRASVEILVYTHTHSQPRSTSSRLHVRCVMFGRSETRRAAPSFGTCFLFCLEPSASPQIDYETAVPYNLSLLKQSCSVSETISVLNVQLRNVASTQCSPTPKL